MPVAEREGSRGQVLRGVCSKCETVTKGKTLAGQWLSQCVHPATDYHGRMMVGGAKTVPVIPEGVDLGDLSMVGAVIDAGVAAVPAPDPVRGMIDKDEPRTADDVPAPVAGDPVAFDVRASLETIAAHARGLAGALAGAQRRLRELEGLVATQAIEGMELDRLLKLSEDEVARLRDELKGAQNDTSGAQLNVGDAKFAAAEVDLAERIADAFDPDEILF